MLISLSLWFLGVWSSSCVSPRCPKGPQMRWGPHFIAKDTRCGSVTVPSSVHWRCLSDRELTSSGAQNLVTGLYIALRVLGAHGPDASNSSPTSSGQAISGIRYL